jgi:hypothetical protein
MTKSGRLASCRAARFCFAYELGQYEISERSGNSEFCLLNLRGLVPAFTLRT